MINFKSNIPELDRENALLFKASQILESISNRPGLTANEFYLTMARDISISETEFDELAIAAVSIESMMSFDPTTDESHSEPTIH